MPKSHAFKSEEPYQQIFLTMPVTTALVKDPFSSLKIKKIYYDQHSANKI